MASTIERRERCEKKLRIFVLLLNIERPFMKKYTAEMVYVGRVTYYRSLQMLSLFLVSIINLFDLK